MNETSTILSYSYFLPFAIRDILGVMIMKDGSYKLVNLLDQIRISSIKKS